MTQPGHDTRDIALGPKDGPKLVPKAPPDAHKGIFGHVVIVAGQPLTPGAAILAGLGALRSGAGRVSWATDARVLLTAPTRPCELMLRLRDALPDKDANRWATHCCERADAVVVGPGLGTHDDAAEVVAALLRHDELPIVVDADALRILGAHPQWLGRTPRPNVVLTPHPGEAARLLNVTVDTVQNDRQQALTTLVQRFGCCVVLKGAPTRMACSLAADEHHVVEGVGGPALSHGGTGDVLSGLIGGLLAQRLPTLDAAKVGVLAHAIAGDVVKSKRGQRGVLASEVAKALGDVWRDWQR